MILYYTNRAMSYPVIIREFSTFSRWEQMQRPTEIMRRERLSWRSLSNPYSQSLGNHWEENAERIKESEVKEAARNMLTL